MKDLLLFVPLDTFAKAQYEFFPLGTLYLSSYLSRAGFEVDVVHGLTQDIKPGYKYYGLSACSAQYTMIKEALKFIREIQPGATVVAGGAHFNAKQCIDEALLDDWDYIVSGEGELALLDIVSNKIAKSQRVVYGTPIQDLDSIPFPDYDKLDVSKYNFPLKDGLVCSNIVTSRGCPFKCAFCSTSNKKVRQRSAENVLEEVDILVNKHGFDSLMFVDDTMSINSKRYYSILSGLEKYNVSWRSYARVTTITYEGLERMKRSGCVEAGPGVESGNQGILDLVGKGTNVEENIAWCRRCEEVGITCTPSLIIGLPNESPDTIKDARVFMERARTSAFAYNVMLPLVDSPIMQNYDYWKQYLTVYPYTWDECVTKSKKITKCFVSTPYLTREQILEEYYKNYDYFADITGFDPRKRGTRKYDSGSIAEVSDKGGV